MIFCCEGDEHSAHQHKPTTNSKKPTSTAATNNTTTTTTTTTIKQQTHDHKKKHQLQPEPKHTPRMARMTQEHVVAFVFSALSFPFLLVCSLFFWCIWCRSLLLFSSSVDGCCCCFVLVLLAAALALWCRSSLLSL